MTRRPPIVSAGCRPGRTDVHCQPPRLPAPRSLTVAVLDRTPTRADFVLPSVAYQLEGQLVSADAVRGFQDGRIQQASRARGSACSLTRADIERRHPRRLSEMLRYVAGVTIVTAHGGRASSRSTWSARRTRPTRRPVRGALRRSDTPIPRQRRRFPARDRSRGSRSTAARRRSRRSFDARFDVRVIALGPETRKRRAGTHSRAHPKAGTGRNPAGSLSYRFEPLESRGLEIVLVLAPSRRWHSRALPHRGPPTLLLLGSARAAG